MGRCIYCREELTGAEPAEHIIPQEFGTFHPNITIHCVCAKCNHFFGSTLEWPMRNSSPEGVLRLVHELGQGQIGNIGTNGIEFKIAESEDWLGARVLLKTTKSGKCRVDLIPQVGARTSSEGEWTWYL